MVENIFYWTGVVIWWSICFSAIGVVIATTIVAPILSYLRIKKYFWQWKWGSELAHTGLTQEDVRYALAYAKTPNGVSIQEIPAWVEQVKTRTVSARKLSKQ